MKTIFVRKVFPYDPTFGGKFSRFDGYCRITLQNDSPGIKEIVTSDFGGKINAPIFSSSLKRAEETAQSIARMYKLEVRQLEELREVVFDLGKLVSREEFEKFGSNLVRDRFIEAFVKDSLAETREKIKDRMQVLLKYLNSLPSGKYLLISHSFFMKLLQIYLADSQLFSKPRIIRQYFNPKIKTFDFGKGFDFSLE